MGSTYYQTGHGRVFLQKYGAGPGHPVSYEGCTRLGGYSEPLGDITPVYCPDPSAYNRFEVVDEVRGEGGLPTTSMIAKFGKDNPIVLLSCPFDLQAHYGKCRNPQNFDDGWETIVVFEKASLTTRGSDELTAFDPEGRAEILITGEITARAVHFINQMLVSVRAESLVTREVVDVVICDNPSCGECGDMSDGCQDLFAVARGSGLSSPGLPAELLYSLDGGLVWNETDIDTLASDEDPSAVACVGDYIAVVSNDSNSLHWADVSDLDAWTEIAGVFNAVGAPNDIFSAGPDDTWIVGNNGYIYFTSNVTSTGSYETQEAGALTGEDVNRIHGMNELTLVAVCDNNVVLFTLNGGQTWQSLVGPAPGEALTAIWVRSDYSWLVGTDTGNLHYTDDQGVSWVQAPFPGDGTGEVYDLSFTKADSPFGFLAHGDGTDGYILRTLNGGFSWHQLPEPAGATIPDSTRFNSLAACEYDPNFVLGGGLSAAGTDGILVIGK